MLIVFFLGIEYFAPKNENNKVFLKTYGSICYAEERDCRIEILNSLKKELTRSMRKLQLEDFEVPYFISYWLKEEESVSMRGKFGGIVSKNQGNHRNVYVEVRVGDYTMDNTERSSRFDFGMIRGISSQAFRVPLDNDEFAIRKVLWYVTDFKYKEALDHYLKKKGEKIFLAEKEHIDDFSREEPYVFYDEKKKLDADLPFWESVSRDVTSYMNSFEVLNESGMDFNANFVRNYFVNSEGSEIVTESTYYSINIFAKTLAEDGMPIENSLNYKSTYSDELPGKDYIENDVKEMIQDLLDLRTAPELKPYNGPAILGPSVTGVIIHEALGHRLEGERQRRENSGQTFTDKIGEKVIPEFLTIIDDPTLEKFEGKSLFGYYKFDNEGIPSRRVTLIDHGILKNYLMSRTPIKGFNRSNGHGRSDGSPYSGDPIARMANMIILSDKKMSMKQLKKNLIDECKKQEKPYGLIIKNVVGGETNTSRRGMQAFRETPVLVYTVDVNTGEETLVRGVEIVGTPLSSINKILATGDDRVVFNGYCGAESGFIPVATITPSVLISEIEMQKNSQEKSRPPLLPPPEFEK